MRDQPQRFLHAVGLRQHVHQALQGGKVVLVARQHAAEDFLRLGVLAALGQHAAQRDFGRPIVLRQFDGLFQLLLCLFQFAGFAGAFGAGVERPVPGDAQHLLPAAARARLPRGAREEFHGFVGTLLLEAQDAHATQRVGVVGIGLEQGGEVRFGAVEVAAFQFLECAAQLRVLRRGRGGAGRGASSGPACAAVLLADLGVVRMGLQVGFEQGSVGGAGITVPGQRRPPAFVGVAADVLARRQPGQAADAFGPGAFLAGQQFGQRERDLDVVGAFAL
ncbi:hypothetical protein EGT29_22270 [Pigmentiphaga sp. H8]|nr:hypothetical protein [Pigmentiphaga sp. H8]AZG10377.1 hypothetical protein EGT29_22270 [Pigmentiphaga sp. H8]